jgi:CRISPR/Cas system CSM-associated protein Csm2 small subunit
VPLVLAGAAASVFSDPLGVHTQVDCAKCHNLENEVERSVASIHSVAARTFHSTADKLRALREAQAIRDNAVRAFYHHKKSHSGKVPSRKPAASWRSDEDVRFS